MDFDFFHNLSTNDAKKFLNNFLDESAKGFLNLKSNIEAEDITIDFSIESLFPIFVWVSAKLKALPEKEDESLPTWIRETQSYKKGLYSFDEASKVLILRFSYYMGECFVRSYDNLSWSIGRKKTVGQNTPVVTGFKTKLELSVMMVSENMLRSTAEDNEIQSAETAIKTWVSFAL